MVAWGNALGGWRRQRRAKNGQFGNGSGGKAKATAKKTAKKSTKTTAKKNPPKVTSKKSAAKKKPTRAQQYSKGRRNARIISTAVIGLAIAGAAFQNRRLNQQADNLIAEVNARRLRFQTATPNMATQAGRDAFGRQHFPGFQASTERLRAATVRDSRDVANAAARARGVRQRAKANSIGGFMPGEPVSRTTQRPVNTPVDLKGLKVSHETRLKNDPNYFVSDAYMKNLRKLAQAGL